MTELLWRKGQWEHVTPEAAGWRYLHFGVRDGSFSADTGAGEIALVPIGEVVWRVARRELAVVRGLRHLLVLTTIAACCMIPQLAMWKEVYGTVLTVPQGGLESSGV